MFIIHVTGHLCSARSSFETFESVDEFLKCDHSNESY